MSWVKIDDRIFDNPKIAALSDAAKVAYLESLTYCARELTDGFVPHKKAKDYAGKPRVVQELVPHLWEPVNAGFLVHDYLKYNPTRAEVMAKKQAVSTARSKAGSQGAATRWQPDGKTDSKTDSKIIAPLPQSPSLPDPVKPQSPQPAPEGAHSEAGDFPEAYRLGYEGTTGKPITGYLMLEAIKIAKEYGPEACLEVAPILGWDKSPKYYIGALEDKRNGRLQTTGRTTGRGKGSAGPGIEQWERFAAGED